MQDYLSAAHRHLLKRVILVEVKSHLIVKYGVLTPHLSALLNSVRRSLRTSIDSLGLLGIFVDINLVCLTSYWAISEEAELIVNATGYGV